VTIGSTVDMAGAFHGSVLAEKAHITDVVSQYDDDRLMLGQSDLVHTTQMNQGSVSMSGAYGVSGVEKVAAAVSGYWGSSSGESGKSTHVVFQIVMRAGFETVSFDALSPALLMGAMKTGPQQIAMRALQHYNELMQALKAGDLLKAFAEPPDPKYQTVRDACSKWLEAAQEFRANYGEGAVVGVVWGGVARSEMTIEDKASTRTWKYGGAAQFTAAGVGASVSVGATYDASGSTSTSDVTVSCTSSTMGYCAKPYTDAWDAQLNGKAFDAIAKIAPLAVPQLAAATTLPTPPDFVKPTPPKDAAGQVQNVKKQDLESVAKVAAYDRFKAAYDQRRKPGDPEFSVTLEQFLKHAEQAPSAGPMRDLGSKVRSNQLSTLTLLPDGRQARPAPMSSPGSIAAAPGATQSDTQFVPIGVWISNWGDLLPWLATGYLNAIDDTAGAESAIKFRMMMQDFLTLSRLYNYAASYNLELAGESNSAPTDFTQIADSFFTQYSALAAKMATPEQYPQAAADAVRQLGDTARGIYQRWDDIKFLRNAELGLGVLCTDGNVTTSPMVPATPWFLAGDDPGVFQGATSAACSFSPSAGNYSAFAQFYKLLPLILPTSRKLVALGPGGILCGLWDPSQKCVFSRVIGREVVQGHSTYEPGALEFMPNQEKNTLEGGGVTLYPIRFSAATGDWKGQSLSTNVGADGALNDKLKALADDLEASGMTNWSYSSDSLPDDWTGDDAYSRLGVRKQYFGILPEPPGAF
jgi:hypothetical protein